MMDMLIARAADLFGVPAREICGPLRTHEIAHARFAVACAARRQGWTLKRIAHLIGRSDHTTVIHAVEQAEKLAAEDDVYAAQLAAMTAPMESPIRVVYGRDGTIIAIHVNDRTLTVPELIALVEGAAP